ncbi:FecR family protein [Sphingomonas nostoxanthinifaciens]|uniref:FecR family protein n=1 Tax=Sphingomonas nostoxanthinifaciens TaxID=2872652 RepID=UPI001CC1E452|nr:DUF4880 domain-containing protein [Sphingomonas nostoxanthinifaciens]UAK23349.1 DUF4880 domain-containing protein [Sphingomonas nostoxanthinifaciens]
MDSSTKQQDEIEEQAAAWLTALDSGRADRAAFERWRAVDTAHALAFIRVDRVWRDLDKLGRLQADAEPSAPTEDRRPSRRGALAAAATAATLAAGGGVFVATQAAANTVETAVGERRRFYVHPRIALDLNTASQLRWWNKDGGIEVELERGEVSVLCDAGAPPCLLHADASQFRLSGGRFNVRLHGAQALDLVTIAGEADMLEPRHQMIRQRQKVRLSAQGEQMRPVSDSELEALAAWQNGELLFAGEPLDVAVAEFNRYLPTPLELGSADIATVRLGGRFLANDPSEFLKALRVDFGIHAQPEADRIVLRR